MGQISDDVVDGLVCQLCLCFFKKDELDEKPGEPSPQLFEHGYPVVCWECWKDLTNKEKKEYQKASVPTL